MKVLLVNKFHYKKGGSETYYFTLAEALKEKGHDVIFFSMKDKKNIPCEQEKYFVSNADMHGGIKSRANMLFHLTYSKEAYNKMKELLHNENPDLVLFNLVHKQITLSIIDAIKEYNDKLPIFWTMHDLIAVCPAYTMLNGHGEICEKCLSGNFNFCVKNRCIKDSKLMSMLSKYEADMIRKKNWYNKIDLFICPSEFYRKKLTDAKFTSKKIVMLRNPLPRSAKYELNDNDNGYVLYFGRLVKEKGIKTLINASRKSDCKLVIAGTGPLEKELKRYAKNYGNVEFSGFQAGEKLQKLIRESRCVVLPSEWYENGPYSAMEAMALGKPLIVSNNGGLPELVEDGKNGYIYDAKTSAAALAGKIEKIFGLSKNEYKCMCEYSLKKAKDMFDLDEYIDNLESYYYEISNR